MRGVDLTPPEERRGSRAPTRTGGLHYVALGLLGVALLAVIVTAFTNKQISDGKSDLSRAEQELQQAEVRARALKPFADFRMIQEARTATVRSLAQSRFDWERVIRELALILPSDVWLVNLTGTVLPDVNIDKGASITTRESVAGPALELVGCAPSQDAVAGFVAALEDIDGVTRVGLASSELPEETSGSAAPAEGSEDDCRTRDFISKFEIVVAFDAVPAPESATTLPPSVPAPLGSSEDGAQLADAQAQQSAAAASASEQTGEAQSATETYIPGN
jgi:Tfp pilus assembly protein PilN